MWWYLRPFVKESQKISLFLLSFLWEGEEAVEDSSIDLIPLIGPGVRCEKMHRISFLLFLKFLFYLSNREENLKFRIYIFLGSDCPRKRDDGLKLPRDERKSEKKKSNPSCLRQEKVSLPVTSSPSYFHCSDGVKGRKNWPCRIIPSDLGRLLLIEISHSPHSTTCIFVLLTALRMGWSGCAYKLMGLSAGVIRINIYSINLWIKSSSWLEISYWASVQT